VEELPRPEPGPGQVRVAVLNVGVSFADVLMLSGRHQIRPAPPFIPGLEGAGVVDALGEGVTRLQVGARVNTGGLGAMAEYGVFPAASVHPFPHTMPFDDAAVFRGPYTTAFHALIQRGSLVAGETVVVLGAGGAVGVATVQLAKALGARVIASASSRAKRELAARCGADATVDGAAPDWRGQVAALTGGRGVDIVVDTVGAGAAEPAFRSLTWGGRHLVVGFAHGAIPSLPTDLALQQGAAIVGVDTHQFAIYEPQTYASNLQALFALYAAGRLAPPIAARFSLADCVQAMKAVEGGALAGRVLIEVD